MSVGKQSKEENAYTDFVVAVGTTGFLLYGHETTKKGSSIRDKPISVTLQNNGFGLSIEKFPLLL